MEMRLLTTNLERRIFVERLAEARDQKLTHFSDVRSGEIDNSARLAASNLYGLFERGADSPERMIAGMAIHNLEMFPRTCPGPDLSHLSDKSVFECSDHWSLAIGAGMRMWCGAAIQIARQEPGAVLAYLAAGHSDHTGFYAAMGFVPFGEPTQFLYLKTREGFPWVQPVILRGVALQKLVTASLQIPVEANGDHSIVRFGSSLRLRPVADSSIRGSSQKTTPSRRETPPTYASMTGEAAQI
ncbi:MAG: hypothetical protein ACLQDV_22130 [Candidatus Binataceae bacterium]